jgi:hypothetical protein
MRHASKKKTGNDQQRECEHGDHPEKKHYL